MRASQSEPIGFSRARGRRVACLKVPLWEAAGEQQSIRRAAFTFVLDQLDGKRPCRSVDRCLPKVWAQETIADFSPKRFRAPTGLPSRQVSTQSHFCVLFHIGLCHHLWFGEWNGLLRTPGDSTVRGSPSRAASSDHRPLLRTVEVN